MNFDILGDSMANKIAGYCTPNNTDIVHAKPFLQDRLTINDLKLKLHKNRLRADDDVSRILNFAIIAIGADVAEGKDLLSEKLVRQDLDEIVSLLINFYSTKLVLFVSPICGPNPDEQTVKNIKTINLAMQCCARNHLLKANIRYICVLHHFLWKFRKQSDVKHLDYENFEFRNSTFLLKNNEALVNSWNPLVSAGVMNSLRMYITKIASEKIFEGIFCDPPTDVCEINYDIEYVINDILQPEEMQILTIIGKSQCVSKFDSGCGLTSIKGCYFDEVLSLMKPEDRPEIYSVPGLRLRSANGSSLTPRGVARMKTLLVCSITGTFVPIMLNYIIVEDLSTNVLFGFKDAVLNEMAGLFKEQILMFLDRDPVVGIGLVGCQRNPTEVIRETAARMLAQGGKPEDLIDTVRQNCGDRVDTNQLEQELYNAYYHFYEVTTQFERLNLLEPPPIEIKYDKRRIIEIQDKFPDLWSQKTGKFNVPDIKLDLRKSMDEIYVNCKEWSHPIEKYEAAQVQIDEYLREGIIEPSSSRFASNIVIVEREKNPKPGEIRRVRVCLDARAVNQFLWSPQNKTPNIEVLKQQIAGAKVFSRLDIRNAFLTLPLHKCHRPLTAFRYKGRLYQYTRVPFGLVSSMAVFVDTMTKAFEDLR